MLDVDKPLTSKVAIRTNVDVPMVDVHKTYIWDLIPEFKHIEHAHIHDLSFLGPRWIVPRNSLRIIDELYQVGKIVYAHVVFKCRYTSDYWIPAYSVKDEREDFIRTVNRF